jgi:hypothetical protein
MKRKFCFVGFAFFLFCFGQNVNAQSTNNVQRIIGSWVSGNTTFTFNTNGTLVWTVTDKTETGTMNCKYVINDTKIFVLEDDSAQSNSEMIEVDLFFDYVISSDGKTLILILEREFSGWFTKQ